MSQFILFVVSVYASAAAAVKAFLDTHGADASNGKGGSWYVQTWAHCIEAVRLSFNANRADGVEELPKPSDGVVSLIVSSLRGAYGTKIRQSAWRANVAGQEERIAAYIVAAIQGVPMAQLPPIGIPSKTASTDKVAAAQAERDSAKALADKAQADASKALSDKQALEAELAALKAQLEEAQQAPSKAHAKR